MIKFLSFLFVIYLSAQSTSGLSIQARNAISQEKRLIVCSTCDTCKQTAAESGREEQRANALLSKLVEKAFFNGEKKKADGGQCETTTLRCGANEQISIRRAVVGNQERSACKQAAATASHLHNKECSDSGKSTELLVKLCHGRNSCEFVFDADFGSVCECVQSKYLNLTYTCEPSRDEAAPETKAATEDQLLTQETQAEKSESSREKRAVQYFKDGPGPWSRPRPTPFYNNNMNRFGRGGYDRSYYSPYGNFDDDDYYYYYYDDDYYDDYYYYYYDAFYPDYYDYYSYYGPDYYGYDYLPYYPPYPYGFDGDFDEDDFFPRRFFNNRFDNLDDDLPITSQSAVKLSKKPAESSSSLQQLSATKQRKSYKKSA